MVFIIAYALIVCFMYVKQRSFIYFPDTSVPDPAAFGVPDVEIVEVVTPRDKLSLKGWFVAPRDPGKPVIVVFHGNAGNIGHRNFRIELFARQMGYGMLLAEYRGYGGNPGQPSQQGFYDDARAYMEWLIKERGYDPGRIVLQGESIGSGVATRMAVEYSGLHAIILETPYTDLPTLAQQRMFILPAYWLLKDRFNNVENLRNVRIPLLILHGKLDTIISYRHGRKLFEKANEPKTFETFEKGGHNDLYGHGAALRVFKFLESLPPMIVQQEENP